MRSADALSIGERGGSGVGRLTLGRVQGMHRRLSPPVAARLSAATADLPGPLAVVDLDAFDAQRRHPRASSPAGMPIRIATKSLRSRPLIERALGRDGFAGLMCYAVREALWWARDGHDNLLVAYPSVDVPALAELAADPALTRAVVVMIDSVEHVDFIAREVPGHEGLRVAIDVDASLRVGPAHLGVRRSPTRTPADVEAVIRRAQERGLVVAGLMFYDAQIAGLPDSSPVVRRMKKVSDAELRDPPRRGRRGRPRPRRPRGRQRRRHRQPARHAPRPVPHRARRRVGALRPDALRRLRRAVAATGRLLRRPGGAPTRRRGW